MHILLQWSILSRETFWWTSVKMRRRAWIWPLSCVHGAGKLNS